MADYATKDDVRKIVGDVIKNDVQQIVDKAINKAVTDLSEVIASFAQQVDERFNALEQRVDIFEFKTEARFDAVEKRLDGHDARFDHLLNTIDSFMGRVDHYETEQVACDRQFERQLEWNHKVSVKIGIPLENL
jgi:hypothetical protein